MPDNKCMWVCENLAHQLRTMLRVLSVSVVSVRGILLDKCTREREDPARLEFELANKLREINIISRNLLLKPIMKTSL